MKKSEMIKIMDEALAVYFRQYVGNPHGYTSTECLLDVMIKVGMLPPASGFTGDETIHDWEPEDE